MLFFFRTFFSLFLWKQNAQYNSLSDFLCKNVKEILKYLCCTTLMPTHFYRIWEVIFHVARARSFLTSSHPPCHVEALSRETENFRLLFSDKWSHDDFKWKLFYGVQWDCMKSRWWAREYIISCDNCLQQFPAMKTSWLCFVQCWWLRKKYLIVIDVWNVSLDVHIFYSR